MIVYGTRPEIIKLSPVINELNSRGHCFKTVFTGQHEDLYEDVKEMVPEPDHRLYIMQKDQTLVDILANMTLRFGAILRAEKPDLIILQGDTSTVTIAALIAFYEKIPIGHIEAGLRTYDLTSPFPEEGNRQIVSRLANYNWAPTKLAAEHLRAEKIKDVFVTGNTVIDACLKYKHRINYNHQVLVTMHRRESFGSKMEDIFNQLNWLAKHNSDLEFVFPMHPNPNIQRLKTRLKHVKVIKPLKYPAMMKMLSQVRFIISDSGGIQEECAAFQKKILVCRDKTERPEGVQAGFAKLVGSNIAENFTWANDSPQWKGKNPYGNGQAAANIIDTLYL